MRDEAGTGAAIIILHKFPKRWGQIRVGAEMGYGGLRANMNDHFENQRAGALWGSLIADALAMPVHWYYDREALRRDYGQVGEYLAPHNPHPDSILWRSAYHPIN